MKNYFVFKIAISLTAVIITAFVIARIMLSRQFSKEVSDLFTHSKSISEKLFSYEELSGLPVPVQRYFKHVLTNGQSYVSYVRLTHDGQFKSGLKKDWANIVGEEYFTTEQPGFIWKGKTNLFTARDLYIAGRGRLVVSLFSLFKVADYKGEKFNQGELLRWLGESVWFPTNLLPSENLKWSPIDSNSAMLSYKQKDLSISYTITFNNKDEIVQLATERYMADAGLEKWVIRCSNYQQRGGMLIPITAEVLWRLKAEDFTYAKFNIKKIEYDQPKKI
ncbi:hypothetical protein ACVWYN_003652 [Pedobacter sp. UYP24]